MYYIDDYRKQAIDKIIPYLIEFPEIVSIIEDSADRYQAIEDVLWKIADNFKVVNSRGVFLNAHAHNEVVNLIYTDKAKDAFTYGTQYPETQAFGTGHFYSQASYISGISKDVSEDKLIRAVQEKIIQNNTNGTIREFIEAMKLHFNATSINIYESYPLAISLMLSGEKLELSSSGNKEAIKKCLPACVSLNNLYVDDHLFDQFTYSNNSNYANDSRYPITLGDSDYMYKYISTAINLDSNNEEYIKINNPFYNANYTQNETPFECICGQLINLSNNGVLYSFIYNSTNTYKISFITRQIDGEYYFVLSRSIWDDTNSVWQSVNSLNTNIKAETNKDYTFLLSINRNSFDFFRIWIFDSVKLIGENTLQDASWAYNIIQNNTTFTEIQLNETSITYDAQNMVNAEITNYTNDTVGNFSDFTYYCIFGGVLNNEGNIEINNESSHYYITCFGEKNLLFNCLSNNNHVIINTNSTLQNNLTVKQSSYNYKKWHSNGRYMNVYNPDSINAGIQWGEGGWSTPIQVSFSGYWSAITYGNGTFVAVGTNGYISTSTDGITWGTPIQIGTNYWYDVVYGNSTFIAIGSNGYISTSTNGKTWTTPIQVDTKYWVDIAYGDNKFVIFDGHGYTSTSTDGITWTTPIQVGTFENRGISYGNSIFVLVGLNGYISTSTDGITWGTPIQVGTNHWNNITYGNGTFIAVGSNGYITTSTDGITWTTPIQVSANGWSAITYGNGTFIAVGSNGYTTTSTDGITWTTPIQVGTNTWVDIAYGNNKFVAVSNLENIVTYTPFSDVLINSFEISLDICIPTNGSGNILKGLIGDNTALNVSLAEDILSITIPTYTSGNIEVPYTIDIEINPDYFNKKFNNLKLKYEDNNILVYIDNTLLYSEYILDVNIINLSTKLELGPINAFIKNFKFNCNYVDGVQNQKIEYSIPLTKDLYEEKKLISPTNYNARFLTTPQLIDDTNNKDLFNNETLRIVNF